MNTIIRNRKKTLLSSILSLLFLFTSWNNCEAQETYLTLVEAAQQTFLNNRYENQHSKLAQLNVNNGERYLKKLPSYGNSLGFLIKHKIQKRILFCYGLSYSQHSQRYRISRDSMNTIIEKGSVRLTFINLPFLLQYNFVSCPKYSIYFFGGPQLSFLFYERGGVPVYDKEFISFNLVDAGGLYKKNNFDGVVGLGAERKISAKTYVFIQGRFSYGFNNIENKSAAEFDFKKIYKIFVHEGIDRSPTHAIAYGLAFGVTFKIR